MPTIIVTIPTGVSAYQLAAAARSIEFAAEAAIGVACETNVDISDTVPDRTTRDLTRRQELAADAMASKHGRSRVRRLADGAVEITGMLDDIEREMVCIEPDGRERWRR